MKKLLTPALMVTLIGCQGASQQIPPSFVSEPTLFLGGSLVFENGCWIDKLYIENHGKRDLVVGDDFSAHYTFVGSDGVGSISWYRPLPQYHYVILRPVARGSRGYSRREQITVNVPLQADSFLNETTHANIHFELRGQELVAEAGRVVPTQFKLELEQNLPTKADNRNPSTRAMQPPIMESH